MNDTTPTALPPTGGLLHAPLKRIDDFVPAGSALEVLRLQRRWCAWSWETRAGKRTKVPYGPGDVRAESNNPMTWCSYDEARTLARQRDGVGFMLDGHPNLCALDLDNCRDKDTGEITPWAVRLVEAAQSYCEITPSGTGLRILGLIPPRISTGQFVVRMCNKDPRQKVEVYCRAARFITLTENLYEALPTAAKSLSEIPFVVDEFVKMHKAQKAAPAGPRASVGTSADALLNTLPLALRSLLINGLPEGQRSEGFQAAVGSLKGMGWSESEIEAAMLAHPNGIAAKFINGADRLAGEIARSYGKAQGRPYRQAKAEPEAETPARPSIWIGGGRYTEIAVEAETAILAAGLPVFIANDELVAPGLVEARDANNNLIAAPGHRPITTPVMRQTMDRAAEFYIVNAEQTRICKPPPKDIAELILNRNSNWQFRFLAGTIRAPTLRKDGSILATPGYDRRTGLYLLDPPKMKPVAERPTEDEARAALRDLEDLLTEFHFDTDLSRSVAISLLLSAVARPGIGRCPLHAISAPDAGSGKSYLADCSAMLAMGLCCPVIAKSGSGEELEKRLDAEFLAGRPIFSVDNINGELYSDKLCQALSQDVLNIRPLGVSKSVPVRPASFILATGNNLRIAADLVRRTVLVRLDAGVADPHALAYHREPVALIERNRGKYLRACLTILRAAAVSGDLAPTPLAGFRAWSDRVRSALTWLGLPDPVDSIVTIARDDTSREPALALFEAWEAVIGLNWPRKVADLISEAAPPETRRDDDGRLIDPDPYEIRKRADLREALTSLAGRANHVDPKALGHRLAALKDKIIGRYRLRRDDGVSQGAARWKLTATG